MVLRRLLKTIQDDEISFQVPRLFKTKERSKTEQKLQNSHWSCC